MKPNKFNIAASLVLFGLLASCGGNSNGGQNSTSTAQNLALSVKKLPLKILVIGQSISSNCNEFKFSAVTGVNQVSLDGVEKSAADPFEWACAASLN